jgi:hypothetical protein
MNDCMWPVGPVQFVFNDRGLAVEMWQRMTNVDGEYCGREILWRVDWNYV